MSRLGITDNSVKGVDPADIPATIAELQELIGELLELPDGTLGETIKKLNKLSYMIYAVGLLKARLVRYLRGQDLDG